MSHFSARNFLRMFKKDHRQIHSFYLLLRLPGTSETTFRVVEWPGIPFSSAVVIFTKICSDAGQIFSPGHGLAHGNRFFSLSSAVRSWIAGEYRVGGVWNGSGKKCIASWTGRGSWDRYFGGADWRPMALLTRVLLNSAGPRKHFSRLHTADCSDRELGAIVAFRRCVRAPVIRK